MDLLTFGRTLCEELGLPCLTIPTGVFSGAKELMLSYTASNESCDILLGCDAQNKPELAKRLFLRLFSGVPIQEP